MLAPVVVVTGCSAGGIGFQLCESFAANGCRVYAASRNVAKMESLSPTIERIALDVNSESSVTEGVSKILEHAGRIDILVNNAGCGCVGPVAEVDMKQLRETFDVNVFGLVAMVQAVAPVMMKQRSGKIINIGSIVAYVPTPWAGVYSATKAAVHSLSDTMRMELQGFGIGVMCVAPGAIKSGIGAANSERTILKPDSAYLNVEHFIRSRASWSQTPHSTPAHALATVIVDNALSSGMPRNLTSGYRSTSALLSYYLPTFLKEWFWGSQFGTANVGKYASNV